MITATIRRSRVIVVALLLACGFAPFAQAEFQYGTSQLNEALTNLGQARPIYKGHRGRAINHVRAAIRELDGRYIRTPKSTSAKTDTESDAKMRAAHRILSQSNATLSGKAHAHVGQAIQEISAALSAR